MSATPALFVVLAAVNVGLAMIMMRVTVSREREVEARERAVEELAEAHRENLALQDELLRQARQAGIADERARLSRELHDTVAQGLVGVIRQLENLPDDLDPAIQQRVERADQAARSCLVDARRAVRALGPQQLQAGDLADAVRAVVASFSSTVTSPPRSASTVLPSPATLATVLPSPATLGATRWCCGWSRRHWPTRRGTPGRPR